MLHLTESRGHFRGPALPQIDANIGVEHIAGSHQRPLRRCGRGSLRFFGNMSAGNSASKSSTRIIPPAFSRNTISSPRRKISTSLLVTRNFFGSPTAWLFPDLNTRAMAIFLPPGYIYRNVYTFASANSRALARAEVGRRHDGSVKFGEFFRRSGGGGGRPTRAPSPARAEGVGV